MSSPKKVIKGLECCFKYETHLSIAGSLICEECPYNKDDYSGTCTSLLLKDALELLKEHEPILLENQHKPYGHIINVNSPWISKCPRCGKKIEGKQTRFCKYCGQAVKWDEQ